MALGFTDVGTTLVELARAYQLSQPMFVAASLGIADRLADGPRSYEERRRGLSRFGSDRG